jgi:metallophosphoesterase superfamily enzyme
MALKNGNFQYDREYYRNGVMTDVQPEALVLGDWHTGDTCPKTRAATIKMIERIKPKRVVFHDLFNGHSINHHERSNNLSKAELWGDRKHELEAEVGQCLKELNFFAYKFPDVQFMVAESNHDLFMAQYIGTENFLADGQNSVFSCRLFVEMAVARKQPVLKTAMELIGKVAHNVRFLNEDEEYRVKGVGLDYHGHRGVNGARGSGASFDRFNLKMITGHEHTPKIYANGMVVGTSTHLKLGYTKGASSWLNAHGILYKDGTYGLISIIH